MHPPATAPSQRSPEYDILAHGKSLPSRDCDRSLPMDLIVIVLRLVHIFGGVFWLGTVWMTAIFLGPTSEAIGSDAEKFMTYISVKLRYPTVVAIAAGSNVLAGLLLYWRDSAGLRLEWISTPTG